MSVECDAFFTSVLWHCWLGHRKGIWPVKNFGVGLLVVMIWTLHVLRLKLSPSPSSSLAPVKPGVDTFWYRFTCVVLENGRQTSIMVVMLRCVNWMCRVQNRKGTGWWLGIGYNGITVYELANKAVPKKVCLHSVEKVSCSVYICSMSQKIRANLSFALCLWNMNRFQ